MAEGCMTDMKFRGCVIKGNSPTVIYTNNRWINVGHDNALEVLLSALDGQKVIVLVGIMWTVDPRAGNPSRLVSWSTHLCSKYKRLSIVLCANTPEEFSALSELWENVVLANQNMLVDENIFFPLDGEPKIYKAIYNAQFLPFKRHELLESLDSIALIGYNFEADKEYLEKIRGVLERAVLLNEGQDGKAKFLSKRACNQALNQSGVGLCLSEKEGAMYASMEYLLSGLPVVSTESYGGRDFFFDDRYVVTVQPSAGDVAEAVEYLNAKSLDRGYVRAQVLQKVEKERALFVDFLDKLILEEGGNEKYASSNWSNFFVDQLLQSCPVSEIVSKCKVSTS
jgi:glycosyltransferase involved in cell wall biosynthesis